MEYTQGFSPRPRTEFGPPLPVGVVGLSEPAEFWFEEWDAGCRERWAKVMPEGFDIADAREVSGQSLSKLCRDASYSLGLLNGVSPRGAARVLEAEFKSLGALISINTEGNEVKISVTDLERSGASKMVKALAREGLASGWPDLSILRAVVGRWDESRGEVVSLMDEHRYEQ
jgi:hypothetical protein